MSTNYHTAFTTENITIAEINERFSDIDAALVTAAAATPGSVSVAVLWDSKATTTDGGDTTATTWHQRDLNQEVDGDSIVSISSNQFTPVAGTYLILASAPGYSCGNHRLRLYNVTQDSEIAIGLNMLALSVDETVASLRRIFTANGTDAYRIDHWAELSETGGLGLSVDDGAAEVYTMILLFKLP